MTYWQSIEISSPWTICGLPRYAQSWLRGHLTFKGGGSIGHKRMGLKNICKERRKEGRKFINISLKGNLTFCYEVWTTIIDILGVPFLDSLSLKWPLGISCEAADCSRIPCFDGLCINRLDDILLQNRGHSDWYLQSIVLPDCVPPAWMTRVQYCTELYVAQGAFVLLQFIHFLY